MTERPLRALTIFAVLLCLPLLAAGQEPEEKKKDEEKELTQVETAEENREGLEKKLDSSLSEFDALILREQEILEQRREAEAAGGGSGGAGTAAAGGGEGEGETAGEGDAEAGGQQEGKEDSSANGGEGTGGSPDEPSGEPIEGEGTPPEEPTDDDSGRISNGRVPPDVGNGEDDDIVARQLREAAMEEEDPELREKLWDEYRAYKFGEKKKETGR
jgi:hypothetical protein